MNPKGIAIVTGAGGCMGRVITRSLAEDGYRVIMVSLNRDKMIKIKSSLAKDVPADLLEIIPVDFSSMREVMSFTDYILKRGEPVDLLMNNAGILAESFSLTQDGIEKTVAVNYLAPYLLTRRLLPLMSYRSRIVCMVSCTHVLGSLSENFFTGGNVKRFRSIPVYSNTKYALTLFVMHLASIVRSKGITVNAADPGIVNTDFITLNRWFDPLADIVFRPFISSPEKGASTAVHLLTCSDLNESGELFASCKKKKTAVRYAGSHDISRLWNETETLLNELIPGCFHEN